MKLILLLFLPFSILAQELPFQEISKHPETYTATTVFQRSIEGLGFRYFWATEGLTEKELDYKPSIDARDVRHTLEHIYSLSNVIASAFKNEKIESSPPPKDLASLRESTLNLLDQARNSVQKLRDEDLTQIGMRFSETTSVPLWNLMSGPIQDAVWHCGQIVSFRRAAGNPIPTGPSFLNGTVKK